MLRNIQRLSIRYPALRYVHQDNALPIPPKINAMITSQDTAEARSWISRFKAHSIPKGLVELTFSRSSGPGGQNVNKVNTKATLRCPVDSPWIPLWARSDIKDSPHYVASTKSILITASVHRSQAQNIEVCLSKLQNLVVTASSASLKTEPSEDQKKRVTALERAEKAHRKQQKSYRSEIKKGRSKYGSAWD